MNKISETIHIQSIIIDDLRDFISDLQGLDEMALKEILPSLFYLLHNTCAYGSQRLQDMLEILEKKFGTMQFVYSDDKTRLIDVEFTKG